MKPRITLVTLGVDDLERALRFYRDGLGLKTDGIVGAEFEHGAVAFFELSGGLRLGLWPRSSIAHDTGLPKSAPSPTDFMLAHNVASKAEVDAVMAQAERFMLAHNVASKAEVDAVMAQAERAGARIVNAAKDAFWGGYTGCFQDPDQHLWEVAWNPQWASPD